MRRSPALLTALLILFSTVSASAQTVNVTPLSAALDYTGITVWHAAGFTGNGAKVGIIDVGFGGINQLGGNIVLPAETDPTRFNDSPITHGTLVYEVLLAAAPDAEFYLFQLNPSGRNITQAVDWMIANAVDVVNYSAATLDIPLDGTNFQAQQVGRMADHDIVVVVAAGNHGISYMSETFTDADNDGWHEFSWGYEHLWAAPLLTEPFGETHLRWRDVYTSAQIDLDLYIYTEDMSAIIATSTRVQQGGSADWPYEDAFYATYAGVPFNIRVRAKQVGTIPEGTIFYIYSDDTTLGIANDEGSITAPADSPRVLAVGAIEANEAIWSRSSRGPTWDGRTKPDLVAPTRLQLATGGAVFTGTSASAPLVSGAVALLRAALPDINEQQAREWLLNNTLDLGVTGADNTFGYGRLYMPPP